jgi:hypothetical protein
VARDISVNDFGLLIAYLLPGFTVVWGSAVASGKMDWTALVQDGASVGAFLSLTVCALAAGMAVGLVRWFLIDSLHHATGIPRPTASFTALSANVGAYTFLNDAHYRYYQHHAGMLLATLWVYGVWRYAEPFRAVGLADLGALALAVLYFLGSRDALAKFCRRSEQLLSASRPGRTSKPRQSSRRPVTSA